MKVSSLPIVFFVFFLVSTASLPTSSSTGTRTLEGSGTGHAESAPSSCYDTFSWIGSSSNASDWDRFDWKTIKTVGFFGPLKNINGLREYAHTRGAKLVKAVSMSDNHQMTNATARAEFINEVLSDAISNGYDGINFDYEGNNPLLRHAFTALVVEAANAFHDKLPGSEVSIDAPIYPDYEFRSYDYKAIAEACDYIFGMFYDGQFWNNVQCASSSSSSQKVKRNGGDGGGGADCSLACASLSVDIYGVESYLKAGVPANKLYIGLPWYGLMYEYIAGIPFFTGQITYKEIQALMASPDQMREQGQATDKTSSSLTMDEKSNTWVFKCNGFCKPDNRATEIWFDDAQSLAPKYALASKYGLKGVGMWEATHASGAAGESDMWKALCPLR